MSNGNLRAELDALMNGAYDVGPLEVGGKAYGNVYAPKDGKDPLLTTYAGEKLCEGTGLLKSVLLDRAYEGETSVHVTEHNSIYRMRAGMKDVAVKIFGQPEVGYLEGTLVAGEVLEGWDNARIPEPYFFRGDVFAQEFVDAPSLNDIRKRDAEEHLRVLREFADTGLMEYMIKNNFVFGEKNSNVLVVKRNGGCEFVIADQGTSPFLRANI